VKYATLKKNIAGENNFLKVVQNLQLLLGFCQFTVHLCYTTPIKSTSLTNHHQISNSKNSKIM